MASLLGIIPLQYYVYLPSHLEGGTGNFLTNEFGFSDIKSKDIETLLERHNESFLELNDVYGNNFTSNMFENMACILGRSRKKTFDVFYYLPWVKKTVMGIKELTLETNIQCVFRIKVHSTKKIELLCKSNDKESIVLSSTGSTSSNREASSVISYDGDEIIVNEQWIARQYTLPNESILKTSSTLKDITLPKFSDYYSVEVSELFIFITDAYIQKFSHILTLKHYIESNV